MSGLGFSLFLRPLANRNCCEIMSGASPGLSGRHPARPLCPVPAHRHARPCPPLFVLQKYERRAPGGAGGDWKQRPLSISCKPDLLLSRSGMQGQTHPREQTSVPDLRLSAESAVKSHSAAFQASRASHVAYQALFNAGNGPPCPGDSRGTPMSSPHPARPMGYGKVPA